MILLVIEVREWQVVAHLVEQGISFFSEQVYGMNGAVGCLSDSLCRSSWSNGTEEEVKCSPGFKTASTIRGDLFLACRNVSLVVRCLSTSPHLLEEASCFSLQKGILRADSSLLENSNL